MEKQSKTIKEVKAGQKELENKIAQLVIEFQSEYEVKVKHIDLTNRTIHSIDGGPVSQHIEVETEIEL